uniref:Uncharacterized protein n=1 Tax=Anopheles stephensi TaxID=30069 RepID=A0A182YLJ0_ANOST
MTSISQDSARKPSPFDNLSRDDLVKKCKGLLGIAQKAKQAKDECQEENRRLKEELSHYETQKNADKECIKAMQEVADSYMDQKLQATMKVDELQKQLTKLNVQLAEERAAHETGTHTMRVEIEQLKEKLSKLAKEFERVNELQEENSNLEKERIALEQELIKVKGSQTGGEKMQQELQNHTNQIEHYRQHEESLQANVESLKTQLQQAENEKNRLKEDASLRSSEQDDKSEAIQRKTTLRATGKERLESQIASLEAELASQSSKLIEVNQHVVQKLVVENQNLEAQLAQLAEKLQTSISKSKQTVERCERLEKESETSKLALEVLDSEKQRLLEEVKQARAERDDLSKRYSTDLKQKDDAIVALERSLEEIKDKALQSDGEMGKEMEAKNSIARRTNHHAECSLRSAKGPRTLSKIAELQDKLSRTETVELEPLKLQIDQLQKLVAERETELERQRDELATALNRSNVSFDAQSDVMSTSTISRVEDVARLREIDESYEEKYIKLRSLAVKLKKKVAEQTLLLAKYEKEGSAGSATGATGADSALQTVTKNVQTLQTENDRLQDQLDGMTAELSKLREALDQKTIELTALEQMQKEGVEGTAKDRTTLETAIREYQTQIQNLKREKDAFQMAKKEIDAENQRLKATLKAKDKDLSDTVEQQKELRSELERSKLASKKANLLTLEMEAYERSLAELNTKLEAKKTLVKELEETIDAQDRSMKSLKQQLTLLEEGLESQQKHSRELKQEVDVQQGKLRQSEHQRMELTGQLEELRDEHDRLKQKVENSRVELEQQAAEKEQTCGSLELEKNALLKQNLSLESELTDVRKEMAGKQQELDDIRTEFASYKIRAQSVLRQNQNKDSSREKELEEELNQLRRSLDAVETKQQGLLKQITDLSRGNEELKHERDRTQNRCKELLNLLEESRLHNESLMEESRKLNQEHQEALKTQRIQNETLVQCYKKQLEEQQDAHAREMEQLQQSVRTRAEATAADADGRSNLLLNNNNLSLQSSLLLGAGSGAANRATFTDEQRISLLLMEREDGEGSESTGLGASGSVGTWRRKLSTSSTARGRNSRDVMPLDELLNTSFDDANAVVLADGEGEHAHGREPSPTVELQATKEQLSRQESRVRHLTAVLAEAEQDLAKLTQLNELLKEEVRRQQRSIEREAHVHNSEYLKNVIFKVIISRSK